MSTVATRQERGGGPEPRLRTIGSVCEELREHFPDVSVSKIRYLEDQGLISPRRTRGGYRLFAPDDIVAVVGQDGLVANAAKYLHGQPVLGFNPEPSRNPGVLVPHSPDDAGSLFDSVGRNDTIVESRTMVEATVDDGQSLLALNEIYLGHPSHQTARYSIRSGERSERQASSGIIVGTGTGATGWCRSAWLERRSSLQLPDFGDPVLAWFVREAWPSPATNTTLTEGLCVGAAALEVAIESDRLIAFGDGIEDDRLDVTWGQTVKLRVADRRLNLAK